MNLSQNYFELFSLPQLFRVDQVILADQYRHLQKAFHPDKFANKSGNEQRLAVQFAAYINTAYQTLRSPLLCAEYLLVLVGEPVNSDSLTVSDSAFLLTQMQWRESLAHLSHNQLESKANIDGELTRLSTEVNTEREQFLSQFDVAYQQKKYSEAKDIVAKLHFIEKMQSEIHRFEDELFS